MLKFGEAPYLECSSKGDKRFSAFYARINSRGNRSIEEIYQAAKVFEDGSTGLSWRQAKGKQPVNIDEVRELYSTLWNEYFDENRVLLDIINQYNGFSDIFGQAGHQCQAEEIYRIRHHPEHLPTRVVHCKRDVNDIYIGRPRSGQPWGFGNPFKVGRDGERGECIPKFETWIKTGDNQGCADATPQRRQWILDNLHTLKGKRLGCWCSPQPCHGDILKELIDGR